MDNRHNSHTGRCVALALLVVILTTLLFPLLDGLSVSGFVGDKSYLVIMQDNDEIRSTGGLIAVLGLVTLYNGNIASSQFHYVATSTSPGNQSSCGMRSYNPTDPKALHNS